MEQVTIVVTALTERAVSPLLYSLPEMMHVSSYSCHAMMSKVSTKRCLTYYQIHYDHNCQLMSSDSTLSPANVYV